MRVLVVEDDADVAGHVTRTLQAAGFVVEQCRDGETAWFLGDTEDFAAVVLDLGLPELDGLSVLKRWREAGRSFPVLVLTARGSWRERVEGINAGADDYLGKPFQGEELVARLRAILRRSAGHASPQLSAGPVTIDMQAMRVSVNGEQVRLSPLEYRALCVLMHRKGQVVGFADLHEQVYGHGEGSANTLEALMTRLRKRLGTSVIETRRGAGYMMSETTP